MAGYLAALVKSGQRAAPGDRPGPLSMGAVAKLHSSRAHVSPAAVSLERSVNGLSDVLSQPVTPAAPPSERHEMTHSHSWHGAVDVSHSVAHEATAPSPASRAMPSLPQLSHEIISAHTTHTPRREDVSSTGQLRPGTPSIAETSIAKASPEASEMRQPRTARTPRISFTELPPERGATTLAPSALPQASAVTRTARITFEPLAQHTSDKRSDPRQTLQPPLSAEQPAWSSRPTAPVEPESLSARQLPKRAESSAFPNIPTQQAPVLLAQAGGQVASLPAPARVAPTFNWPGKKNEERGGLVIGNLEIEVIQEEAPARMPATRPAPPVMADDWEMDRRYVRHLG